MGAWVKACDDCRKPDGTLMHEASIGCNWLDVETVCPHCGGSLRWFRGTPLGDVMDEFSVTDEILP